jgi:fused-like protein
VSGAAALTGVLSQLVLRSPSYAKQFVDAGGVAPALLRRTLHPTLNAPSALIDALLAVSQLARLGAEHYPAIKRADAVGLVAPLLSHRDAGVRARACNALGNMCRHSGFFYDDFADRGALTGLIERCGDSDRTTRKFACFAIGNAGFHGDRLYAHLAEAAAPLTALLRDEEEKTRANAAAALGNLVRNSDALCSDLIRAGALEALVELATDGYDAGSGGAKKGDGSGGGGGGAGGESQSPVKIALFSLGNLCAHADCRAKLLALGFERKIAALADAEDASVRRYVARIEGKIAGGEARGRGRTDAARKEREA